jgi:branched-chain amino acid transport system ATP-binding protein
VMDRGAVVLDGDAATLASDPRVTAAFLGGGFSGEGAGRR